MKTVEVYYLRNKVKVNTSKGEKIMNVPYATVAVEINDDKTVNRGIALCSGKDKFIKNKGRNLALARLKYASQAKANKSEIGKYTGDPSKAMCPKVPFTNLVYYKDAPNEIEKKMFRREMEA